MTIETKEFVEELMKQGFTRTDAQVIADLSIHIAKEIGVKIHEMAMTAPMHLVTSTLTLSTMLVNGVTEGLLKNEQPVQQGTTGR